jgi:hypothetical protein
MMMTTVPSRSNKRSSIRRSRSKVDGKKRSNLDGAASTTPYFPFQSRPGLL